jgi:ABC-type transporter MlaC component
MSANAALTKKVTDLETRLAAVEARLAAMTTAAPSSAPTPAAAGKVTKEKKVRDPDAPKRPASAYILFSNAKRAEVVKANPAAKLPEVAKILGGMWKALTPEQQSKFKPAVVATA